MSLEPIVRQFVREGYHSVPDWAALGDMARALILKKGYRDKTLSRSRGRRRSQTACPNERPAPCHIRITVSRHD